MNDALPSPCSLSMSAGVIQVAYNRDEDARRVYAILEGDAPSPSQIAHANPAQGVIRQIIEDALNSSIPEPWEVAEHATQRILAAIGAGGQAVAWRVSCPDDEIYGRGPDTVRFHPLSPDEIASGYTQQPLYTHPSDERVVEALREAEETLQLVEHPAFPDPVHHEEVKRLGRRIGFGALMSTASAAWRECLAADGDPIGGEFVAGPCHSSIVGALSIVREALAATGGRNNG